MIFQRTLLLLINQSINQPTNQSINISFVSESISCHEYNLFRNRDYSLRGIVESMGSHEYSFKY